MEPSPRLARVPFVTVTSPRAPAPESRVPKPVTLYVVRADSSSADDLETVTTEQNTPDSLSTTTSEPAPGGVPEKIDPVPATRPFRLVRGGSAGADDVASLPVRTDQPTATHARRNAQISKNEEFTVFMREAKDPLHRMAFLLSGDAHRAEELTQQTFERCYRHWHKARAGDPLVYARRVLANLRIDAWRRTRREVLTGPDDLPQDDARVARAAARMPTRSVDDRDAVVRALLRLPLKQRRVVVLRHLLDLSESEVSSELGIPLGTVKSTASRGLAHLRAILDVDPLGGTR
ncbi:RNA polymerase sigma-70 factor, sigma-E family [Promicromonospora umidemergens]|uniref:RNA polymerase sigma-70 factor (Sigma-E family) n=1 Tax=Promicromonospora umidemergens TaxID=629679 RepID=A0ABP8WL88_9MICO|nr:RNA polymerase sigma-70 factor, sigma-E family [Promicromonospora umidemergens]